VESGPKFSTSFGRNYRNDLKTTFEFLPIFAGSTCCPANSPGEA
jgi:hypothetical protein